MNFRATVRHRFFELSPAKRLAVLLFLLCLLVVATWTLYGCASDLMARSRFSRAESRLLRDAQLHEQHATEAERRAQEAANRELAVRQALAAETARAEAAEQSLRVAREAVTRARKDYDKARTADLSAIDPDAQRLCAELAALGYECRRAGVR